MNHELFIGFLGGLGLAVLYAILHLTLLRILWKPLKKHVSYARWVHRFVNPTLMLLVALAAGFAGLALETSAPMREIILPATIAGILAYFAAIAIFLYPKIWTGPKNIPPVFPAFFLPRSKKAHK